MNISFLSRNLNSFTPLEGVFTQGELGGVKVVANVFNSDSQSIITCQIDDFTPVPMERTSVKDPYMNRFLYALEDWLYPQGSTHTWVASLPRNLEPGIHTVTVSFTDSYDNTYQTVRLFEVW